MKLSHSFLISTVLAAALALGGCATSADSQVAESVSNRVPASTKVKDAGIDVAQRALPSLSNSVRQPAHYQHVYVEGDSQAAVSLKTLPLADAVANDILASSNRTVRKFDLDASKLRWTVVERAGDRPSLIEGVGGAGVDTGNLTEVNFDLNETVIINPERLEGLVRKAQLVSGLFYVVGYADESGIESKNYTLSQQRAESVAAYLKQHAIHSSRIKSNGAGISRLYSGLDRNRRVSVTFLIEE
jgi:outer membrane protein OmpA-like peptidoglycan-associated protein